MMIMSSTFNLFNIRPNFFECLILTKGPHSFAKYFFYKIQKKNWREKNYSSKVNVLYKTRYKNPLSKKEEGFEEKGFLI
jgi:hypothetical protein